MIDEDPFEWFATRFGRFWATNDPVVRNECVPIAPQGPYVARAGANRCKLEEKCKRCHTKIDGPTARGFYMLCICTNLSGRATAATELFCADCAEMFGLFQRASGELLIDRVALMDER